MTTVLITILGGKPTPDQLRESCERFIATNPEKFSDAAAPAPGGLRTNEVSFAVDDVFRLIKDELDTCDCPVCTARRRREAALRAAENAEEEEVPEPVAKNAGPEELAEQINRFYAALTLPDESTEMAVRLYANRLIS